MCFNPILLYYFSSCYVPHCRESQDPLSHKIPPQIVSRSVKVLPFLASLMSFHQRVFLTRQIVLGEFFYAFFFLCARLLLFLFTPFCVFWAYFFLGWQVAWKCCTNIPIRYFNSIQKLGNYRVTNYFFTEISIINFISVKHIIYLNRWFTILYL